MSKEPIFLGDEWPPADLDATKPEAPTAVDATIEAAEFAKLLDILNASDDPDDADTAVEALTIEQFHNPPAPAADTKKENDHG